MDPVVIPILVAALVVVFLVASTVRIVPQARRYNIERFGRYRRTLQPGLNFVLPVADRINTKLDVREQVYSSDPKPVITEDNLVVNIDTVLYYQITDPRAAAYEVADYLQAIDQLTVTTLRNVIGSMDLEETLTSREEINTRLRTVLDDATGKWGIRVNRVEIKAIDPPHTIKEAMEKQMRAERDKRAAILHAEGERQAKILTAEGTKQKDILEAQGTQQAMILRADGEAKAVERVFQAVHRNNADAKVLAYKYLETLPHLARSDNNTFWVIPGELTEAIRTVTSAFGDQSGAARPGEGGADGSDGGSAAALEAGGQLSLDSAAPDVASLDSAKAADEVAEQAAAAVNDAKAEAEAARTNRVPGRDGAVGA
ncbi:SPFH domain-containing protein [Streptomyces indicus]|uniref:Regulator of protease activity HflC, stomatin/prohibitin superfamily n=1 Tax=Streptomyces indicus TaxID=417292 RepID=A0A1G8URF4_9ACTN|nr:SPFH domain-containing protein [Streptomyces indicus]SDJ56436.1 Regulator of protease activity HflC, stomatin/prohibitin superfamily [Streptomyces indicus]